MGCETGAGLVRYAGRPWTKVKANGAKKPNIRFSANAFEQSGFQLVADFVAAEVCDRIVETCTTLYEQQQSRSRTRIGGIRNLLQRSPVVTDSARSAAQVVSEWLGYRCFPVRGIWFDKTAQSNWRVPWHQDLTIAVAKRIDTNGFGPWSVKEGIVHVQPPVEVLEQMVTLRLHLDDCDADNGALRVIPGSHRHGVLCTSAIQDLVQSESAVLCAAARGSVLLMRPLLLHASSPAATPVHRRVLHVEFAVNDLPNGLRWFER